MTHTEVVEYLAEHLEHSKAGVRRLLSHTTETIKQLLDRERILVIPRLGTFETKEREKRKGFHPLRRQFMMLPRRRVVTFHPGSSLREHVKNMRVER